MTQGGSELAWRPEGDRRGDRGPRAVDMTNVLHFLAAWMEGPHTQSTPVCKRPEHGWGRVLGKGCCFEQSDLLPT